jgi:hypothetical protein
LYISVKSLGACSLPVLIGPYLGFDCVPVNLDVPRVLLKLLDVFFFAVLLQEAFPVCNNGIYVSFIVDCDFKSAFPTVELDVHLDCSVEQASRQKDLLCLIHLLTVHGKGRIPAGLGWKLLNVVDELHLICLVYSSQSNLDCIEFSAVDAHCGQAGPEGLLFHESAKPDTFLELCLVNVLIEDLRIRRDL